MPLRKMIRLTLSDYISFNFFHLKTRLIAMPIALMLIMPVAVIVIDLIEYGEVLWLAAIVALIIGAIFAGLIALANTFSIRRAAKKQYDSSKALQTENETTINEDGVRESGEFGSTNVGWSDVFKAAEGRDAYYIFFSRLQAFVIPRRLLSPDEETVLRTLLQRHLAQEKLKLISRI